ncbi:MAG TPA: NEW3 domain-containing protein [Bacteroidales bacterium]|nr:NEW3 domain-containing protein [Bacteroidales bacterium]
MIGIIGIASNAASITDSVALYTPFTQVSVSPGESINYTVDVINNTSDIKTEDLSMTGVTRGWVCTMKSEGLTIGQISVLPHDKKSFTLTIDVPLKVNKGTYNFRLKAGSSASLSLSVIISEQGTFKTELTTQQSNMQGHSNSTFTYTATLSNMTADRQNYALMANAPRGWTVTFKNKYQPVTSVSIDPNNSENIVMEIKPPAEVETGTYKIPIRAVTSTTSAELDLEAVMLGTYDVVISTPVGLLSTKITAGEAKKVDFVVNNTGTSVLSDIRLLPAAPPNWEVTFEPRTVVSLLPGKTTQVTATIKASKKAIPGDYVINVEARTPEVSSKVNLRATVETPMLWGWIGVLIIILSLTVVYYLFRKYGRR